MSNSDISATWRYHDTTKHSYATVHAGTHTLDWANRPLPYKIYSSLDPIPLPTELRESGASALSAIAGTPAATEGEAVPDLRALASALFLSAGITRRKRYPSGEIAFRAAACTGALYEIELYVVCQDLAGLAAGLYHFGPADFALRRLRLGDYRGVLAGTTGGEQSVLHAPLTIVCTGTYWRNAWKYQARTYRHFGWDNGTILANLLATCTSLGLPASVICGFADEDVNRLLALDTQREVAFSMVAIGRVAAEPPVPPPLEPLAFDTVRLSASEVDYPLMREMHAFSSLVVDEVTAWRAAARSLRAAEGERVPTGAVVELRPSPDTEVPQGSVEQVILRRGSTRQFKRGASWTFEQLSNALYGATQAIDADFLEGHSSTRDTRPPLLNDLYLIVHAVDGLKPGAYVLCRQRWALELLHEGQFRDEAGYLGLEQDLPADASLVVFFLADLRTILAQLGNRGYRATQLEAGIVGGRLYLAAYAQRLGASGLTFYDDDVVEFFSPHARGKSCIFCMTLGKSVRLRQT